jgi:tRNA threonylcarbamoyladenosine biosynthesis protein TsaE
MRKVKTIKLDEIPTEAKNLSKRLKGGEILALIGPLGSGKTTFTKALGKYLKVKHPITSPTFTLMHAFPARLSAKKSIILYHLDLYRSKSFLEVKALGLTEIWGNQDAVTVIEWADKIKKHLPKKTSLIYFEH